MLPKINLYATLTALVLFLLPWFYFPSFNQMAILSQSGFGACYGGMSVSLGNKSAALAPVTLSPLMITALAATVIATMQALSAFRNGWVSLRIGFFTGLALACILIQVKIGLPGLESLNPGGAAGDAGNPFGFLSQSLGGAKEIMPKAWAYYLEIAALSIPALIGFDSVLNTLKRTRH
ncbi:MAG: hypothetical protein JWO82_3729 [Akkermansiaceae bacterium]|nr:hypothetical protein [Akkermansiaceae bacterium]